MATHDDFEEPGIKAGGPNYVAQLMKFEDNFQPAGVSDAATISDPQLATLISALKEAPAGLVSPEELSKIEVAMKSYDWQFRDEFGRQHDHMKLVGQDNFRRYLPVRELRIRIEVSDSAFEILLRVAAARSVGCRVTLSYDRTLDSSSQAARLLEWLDVVTFSWAADIEFVEESNEGLAAAIEDGRARRVRYARAECVPDLIRQTANACDSYVADEPVLTEGRIELLWYLEEQSISDNYHRYGNLGDRTDEDRASVG